MNLPELPAPDVADLGNVAFVGWSEKALRLHGEACYRAGLERAAVICETQDFSQHARMTREIDLDCAAAIRAEAAKEAPATVAQNNAAQSPVWSTEFTGRQDFTTLSHLRDDASFLVCSVCHRKSFALDGAGERCGMPQPDGSRCGGVMQEQK